MRKYRFLFLLTLIAVVFTSCFKDEEESEPYYYYAMATATQGGLACSFQMDDSVSISPINELVGDSVIVGQRYFVYYALSDTTNHPYRNYPVLMEYIRKAKVQDFRTLYVDSIDIWESKPMVEMIYGWCFGKYINMVFASRKGETFPESFELVRIKSMEQTDSSDVTPEIYLELKHNVAQTNSLIEEHYYSYDISDMIAEFPDATKFVFHLRWNKLQVGMSYFDLDYYPGNPYFYNTLSAINKSFFVR